ncbi:Mobile element protein [Bradyrhizobium sp.]|nr:Mobile element protein [Bradyrhizobium sp.]
MTDAKQGLVMADDQLFEDLPEQDKPLPKGRGAVRLREPERRQMSMQVAALDDLVGDDHPVRAVWSFVEGLDLSALYDVIKAREGEPGHPPASPKLMLALWLWATIDGVGSARQLDRLCRDHLIYRWLCGGVSMNYHSLSNFRIAHMAVLERLLAQGVASMVDAGLVSLDTLAQDGLRVRAGGIEMVHAEGYQPSNYLVDGGFTKNEAIEWAHANGIKVWCPPAQTKHGTDPYAPKKGDGVGVADWRERMKSDDGKAFYRLRCEHECINAHARRMGLRQLSLRGKIKARIHLLWFAVAHNMMRFFALHAKAQAA